jgi:ankyrin repeat protein
MSVVSLEVNIDILNKELFWACRYGQLEVIKLLIDAGADVSARDDDALRNGFYIMDI